MVNLKQLTLDQVGITIDLSQKNKNKKRQDTTTQPLFCVVLWCKLKPLFGKKGHYKSHCKKHKKLYMISEPICRGRTSTLQWGTQRQYCRRLAKYEKTISNGQKRVYCKVCLFKGSRNTTLL